MFYLREENPGTHSQKNFSYLRTDSSLSSSFYLFLKYVFSCFRESCGEGSVKILEDRLKSMGFQYSCINDHL
jgi:hypothetical protein